MRDPHGPGIEPVFLALAGRFLTARSAGKSFLKKKMLFTKNIKHTDKNRMVQRVPSHPWYLIFELQKKLNHGLLWWARLHDSTSGGMSLIPHQGTKIPRATMKVKVKSLSRVQLFSNPWTVACQAPLSVGVSRQEYWSGLPFPNQGNLPNPGDRTSVSCIAGRRFTLWATRGATGHSPPTPKKSDYGQSCDGNQASPAPTE